MTDSGGQAEPAPGQTGDARDRAAPRPRRLSPAARRQLLIREATTYFAEVGFEGSTRELARRIGVTQPLLYRYFPTKDDLIQAVYEAVFLGRWRPEWAELLVERRIALPERLERFYRSYVEIAFTPDWMRIYLFSSLKTARINKRYTSLVEARVLGPIARELYADCGLEPPADLAGGSLAMEMAWSLHAAMFYYAIRQHIYGIPVHEDRAAVIAQNVAMFVAGGRAMLLSRQRAKAKSQA